MDPLIGLGVSLLGSLFGGQQARSAAAPADAAQSQVAQSETDILNKLLGMYTGTYQPAEQALVGTETGTAQNLPYQPFMLARLAQLMTPYQTPQAIVNRSLLGDQAMTEGTLNNLNMTMGQRGIDPNSGMALAARQGVQEQGLQSKYQTMAGYGVNEANQTQNQAQQAQNLMASLFGSGLSTAQSGRNILGPLMQGMNQLMGMYGQAAGSAAAPWNQFSQSLPGAVQAYYSQQSPYGGGGGGAPTYSPTGDPSLLPQPYYSPGAPVYAGNPGDVPAA